MSRILPEIVAFDAVKRIVEKLEDCAFRFGHASGNVEEIIDKIENLPGECTIPMPEITIIVKTADPNHCHYDIRFSLSTIPYSPYFRDCQVSDFLKSEFVEFIKTRAEVNNEKTVQFNLTGTSDEIARFITYHLQLLGFDNSIRLQEHLCYDICQGNISKANFPLGFKAAPSIEKAFCEIKEAFDNNDGDCWLCFLCGSIESMLSDSLSGVMRFVLERNCGQVLTLWEDVAAIQFIVEDEDEILRYHNHQCFDISVDGLVQLILDFPINDRDLCCRLLSDYIINVKGLKREEIMTVTFLEGANSEDVIVRTYSPENDVDSHKSDDVVGNLYRYFNQI